MLLRRCRLCLLLLGRGWERRKRLLQQQTRTQNDFSQSYQKEILEQILVSFMSKSMLSNRQLWSVVQQVNKTEADGNTLTLTCLFQGAQCQLRSPELPNINFLLLHCHMPPSDLTPNHSSKALNTESYSETRGHVLASECLRM